MTTSRARVAYAELRALSGEMAPPVHNAHRRWPQREGLLLQLRDEQGAWGRGEASPLPGYSCAGDDLSRCCRSLQQVPWRELPLAVEADEPLGLRFAAPAEQALAALPPAARCAAETALLELIARRRGQSVATLLRGAPPVDAVAVSALLTGDTVDALLASAAAAHGRGFRVFKLKVGLPDGEARELAVLRALRRQYGDAVALRLDANRAWTLAEAARRLAQLAAFAPELVEEPLADARALAQLPHSVPVALDESLQQLAFAEVAPLLAAGAVQALILKPMALGGPRRCLAWARHAAAHGARCVVTHLFDGTVGFMTAAAVALAIERPLACGLDSHPGLALGPELGPELVGRPQLLPVTGPGLGSAPAPTLDAPGVWSLSEDASPGRAAAASADDGNDGDDGLSLLAAAAAAPTRPALIIDGQVHTLGELAPRVQRLMRWLRARPLAQLPWPRVAVVADNRIETALLLYALLELGVTAVLLHPRLTQSERAALIADCAPALVLDEHFREPTEPMAASAPPGPPLPPAGPLAILYTSGTTGRHKGVMLSRRAFLAAAAASAANLGWRDDDRWLLCMPLSHVGGLSILIRCLLARRPAVLLPGGFDLPALATALVRDRVTLLSVVPTMLRRLLARQPAWAPPPALRAVLLGGAAASGELLAQAAARAVPVLTTYGLTEACSQVTTQRYGTPPAAAQGAGEPLAGVRVRIRPEDDQIQIQGPTLFDGYFALGGTAGGAPAADGWFTTGDLGRLDEHGRLHILARRTDLIVSGGENVYPAEVEQALESCPGIAAACVVGLPDAEWGQQVAAALVATGAPLPLAELRRQLHGRLAAYKHPRQLLWLAALPVNPTGKVDRTAVARQFASAPPCPPG